MVVLTSRQCIGAACIPILEACCCQCLEYTNHETDQLLVQYTAAASSSPELSTLSCHQPCVNAVVRMRRLTPPLLVLLLRPWPHQLHGLRTI